MHDRQFARRCPIGPHKSACGKLSLGMLAEKLGGWFGARSARKSARGWVCAPPHDSRPPTPTTKTCRWGPRASHPNDEDLSLGTPDWSPALRFVLVTKGRAGNRARLPQTLRLLTAKTFIFSIGHSGATLLSQLSFGVLLERRHPGRHIIWARKPRPRWHMLPWQLR